MGSKILSDMMRMLYTDHLPLLGKLSERFSVRGEDAILLCIYHAERPVFAGEFKDMAGLTSGRIASILKQLEAKGWVIRTQDENDRRKTQVALTDAGKQYIEGEMTRRTALCETLFDGVSERDAQSFVRATKKLLTIAEQHDSELQ